MDKTVDVVMSMPFMEGYEYTGEYRQAEKGEYYLAAKTVSSCSGTTLNPYLILKKKAWRAEHNYGYFYIAASGRVFHEIERHADYDQARYEVGNYYKTRDEAEKAAARVLAAYKGD
jgi:hypothetical protein